MEVYEGVRASKINMGIIYKATYTVDPNQIYIGKTTLSLAERRRQHERNPDVWSIADNVFDRMLLETGIKNWEWEVLQDQISDDLELDVAEKKYVQQSLTNGYKLHNVIHNPDHPNVRPTERSKKDSTLGAARAWDPSNIHANRARYFSGKLKPIVNLTTKVRYPTITSLRDAENVSTQTLHKLCESGEPHPETGHQYAFLGLDGAPILKDGHAKKHRIQQDIELLNISTGEVTRCSLFEAARKLKCGLSVLKVMKHLNMGGNRNNIRYNGFLVFAIDADRNRIETESHKKMLEKMVGRNRPYHAWRWDTSGSQWKYEKKLYGIEQCVELLVKELGDKPIKYKSKVAEILEGQRHHVKGYSFSTTPDTPIMKPILKQRPVVLLDSGTGSHKIYIDAKHAAIEQNLKSSLILACCSGRIYSTGGKRFAYADEDNQPLYTERHKAYSRKAVGAGKSVYWVQGDESFRSIAALHRRLVRLWNAREVRLEFVPTRERLSRILSGEDSDELGSDQCKFRITLRKIS
jgi:hypothetical protein